MQVPSDENPSPQLGPMTATDPAPIDWAARLTDTDFWQTKFSEAIVWAKAHLLTLDMALQMGLMLAAFIPAYMFAPRLKRFINARVTGEMPHGVLKRFTNAMATISVPIALWLTV